MLDGERKKELLTAFERSSFHNDGRLQVYFPFEQIYLNSDNIFFLFAQKARIEEDRKQQNGKCKTF